MKDEAAERSELVARRMRTADLVASLGELAPGPRLAAALVRTQGLPLDASAAVQLTAHWDRLAAWATAQAMIPLAEAFGAVGDLAERSGHDTHQIVAQEVAAATNVAYRTAADRVTLVEQVARALPTAWEALDRGDLGLAHVKALSAATADCPSSVAEATDKRVVTAAIAHHWTPSRLAKAAKAAVIAFDPDGAAERAVAAKDAADVTFFPASHETATLIANGDAAVVRRVMDAIDIRAAERGRTGDVRPIGWRRLAALEDFVLGDPGDRPVVEAHVTVDLTTLLGLNEKPGELSGYGPITAETARRLGQDATLRRLVTDPIDGTMIDLGRSRYQPSPHLRRVVEARDRTCRFPRCGRRAITCDKDHAIEWDIGGRTAETNLHALCRMHHNMKTHKLWRVDINADGSETWTSPLGIVHHEPAPSYPIELTDPPPDDDLALADHDIPPPPEPWIDALVRSVSPTPPRAADDEFDTLDFEIERRAFEILADRMDLRLDLVS
jgi:hypothetical protein